MSPSFEANYGACDAGAFFLRRVEMTLLVPAPKSELRVPSKSVRSQRRGVTNSLRIRNAMRTTPTHRRDEESSSVSGVSLSRSKTIPV